MLYYCSTSFTYSAGTSLHVRAERSAIRNTTSNEVLNQLKRAPT
jgi:hypothetical protein